MTLQGPKPFGFTGFRVLLAMAKTHKNLFEKVVEFKNLLHSYDRARSRKRLRVYATRFDYKLDQNLLNLKERLETGGYKPKGYRHFYIFDPKRRLISAPAFEDRIVHHAICNVINPIFDKTFIDDSYACREGKGAYKGVERLQSFLRKKGAAYALKCDISRYFASIDRGILLSLIKKRIADSKLLDLLKIVIDSYHVHQPERFKTSTLRVEYPHQITKRGIPIGNLTSQLFANLYLNEFDHFVKHELKRKYYLRYVDDFVVLGKTKEELHEVKERSTKFLKERLKLELHPRKVRIFPTYLGVDFLGYVVFKDHIRLRSKNVKKFRKRYKKLKEVMEKGEISQEQFDGKILSWVAHAEKADTFRLRQAIFGEEFERYGFASKKLRRDFTAPPVDSPHPTP